MKHRLFVSHGLVAGLAFGLLAAPAVAPAQVTRQGDGYLLRVKFTKGQTIRYTIANSISTSAQGNSTPQAMSIPLSIRVMSVAGNVATLEASVGPMGGQSQPQRQTMRMDTRGKVVGGPAEGIQSLTGVAMPQGPVRIGQSWKDTVQVPSPLGPISSTTTYTFRGIKSVGGRSVAELDITMTGKGSSLGLTGSGKVQILVSDGTLQGLNMTQRATLSGAIGQAPNSRQPARPMTFNTTVRVTRR